MGWIEVRERLRFFESLLIVAFFLLIVFFIVIQMQFKGFEKKVVALESQGIKTDVERIDKKLESLEITETWQSDMIRSLESDLNEHKAIIHYGREIKH